MGGVKDNYLKRESAGDQYVGRCASGIYQLEETFATPPPYFDISSVEEKVEKYSKRKDKILDGCQDTI